MKKSLMINFRLVEDDTPSFIEVSVCGLKCEIHDIRSINFVDWLSELTAKYDGIMCLSFSFLSAVKGDVLIYGYNTYKYSFHPDIVLSLKSIMYDYKRYIGEKHIFDELPDLIKLFNIFLSEKQRVLLGLKCI